MNASWLFSICSIPDDHKVLSKANACKIVIFFSWHSRISSVYLRLVQNLEMAFSIKSNVSFYQQAMPIIWVHLIGIFHNVTTRVEDCYDSVLKFITLARYAELSVHFKLEITWCSVLVDLNCLWITYIMLMMAVVILPWRNIWQSTSYD